MRTIPGAEAEGIAVQSLRDMWNAVWSATLHRDDFELRDARFAAWLATDAGKREVEERVASGTAWVDGEWVSWTTRLE